ncbi:MAG: gliding motility lipoprotein GldJ [Flavobacteriaceae bacterium]|nr:gliding motility lipoprotein GldJ [Flavobacteriaceae bacterium]
MDMKNIATLRFMIVIALSLSMFSCNKSSSSKNSSKATGWKINAKEGGFQYNTSFKEQETAPGLAFIEGGTFTMGKVQDDVMHDWNNSPNQQHVQSFYMDETEVTNLMYLEYLNWIKSVYPPEDPKFKAIYEGALPDTLVWRNRLGYAEMMVNNYLRHPGYQDYPVLGVSWIQAVEFANWRTDRVNELYLEDAGYLTRDAKLGASSDSNFNTNTYIEAPTLAYGGNDSIINPENSKRRPQVTASGDTVNVYANRESGIISPKYRLPSEVEWEYAALGLTELRSYNVYRGRKKYPWDGQYTRSGKRKVRGDQLANFKQGKGDYGGISGWSDDGADITAPVKSFEPNDHGLYDMAGNVAEWVADVYRPIVDDEFNDFNYYRGNVYTKNAIDEEGKVKVVQAGEVLYDTLSNGKLVARNLPGEILQVDVDDNETYLRNNFSTSDNRNFRDGDKRSSRHFDQFGDEEEDEASGVATSKMYNSPKHNVERDSLGNLIKEYDQKNDRTSLINDEVRVYKGGSWKDREYWLDPSQRRYYPQDMATDYIGFRCAMSRVGSKSKERNKKKN